MQTYTDSRMSRPELRRVWREERSRIRRTTRRAVRKAKQAFLDSM